MLVIPTHVTLARLVALLAMLIALLLPSGQAANAQAEQPAGRWGPPFLRVTQVGETLQGQWTLPFEGGDAEMTLTRTPESPGFPWEPWEQAAEAGWFTDPDVTPGQAYTYQLRIVYKQDDTESSLLLQYGHCHLRGPASPGHSDESADHLWRHAVPD